MSKNIGVIGAGSWGTALAILLGGKGYNVKLWARRIEHKKQIDAYGENTEYLPGVKIPDNVKVTNEIEEAVAKSKYIVIAVPSHCVRNIVKIIKNLLNKDSIIINVAKGIEIDSLKRMSEVIREELDDDFYYNIAVLSGPSHAEEVSRNIPTTVVVAAEKKRIAEIVQDLFITPNFRVYTNPDIIGVELGGALKNVIALGAGISDGLGFGDNSKAALMTRGIAEIKRLGIAMGANILTFAGLSGVGDLIVTCTSPHSRNRRAGIELGRGKSLKEILENTNMVIEGVRTTKAAYKLQKKYNVEMPITTELYKVLFEGKHPKEAVSDLMMRGRTHEIEEVAISMNWKL
ncbi:MAG: glycerol-3-phosphate dehydrogenase [Thermosediminibacterales bacterium]|nr:glycerol-3-phosphate dehydrogenase [Thermosediminibacterales bacterium]MDK2836095.1 glycerol-3-phosphate dehydrogenase [Thermosediminibacterales bacterium]